MLPIYTDLFAVDFHLELSSHLQSLHIRGCFPSPYMRPFEWAPLIIQMLSRRLDKLHIEPPLWEECLTREGADYLIKVSIYRTLISDHIMLSYLNLWSKLILFYVHLFRQIFFSIYLWSVRKHGLKRPSAGVLPDAATLSKAMLSMVCFVDENFYKHLFQNRVNDVGISRTGCQPLALFINHDKRSNRLVAIDPIYFLLFVHLFCF